jgi:hypothetical protein
MLRRTSQELVVEFGYSESTKYLASYLVKISFKCP